MVIDGTDFKRQEPHPYTKEVNRKWFTPKFKSAGFRWEVGTSISRGDICWFHGPFPCGMMSDLRIFRLKLKQLLLPGEKVFADKGYKGDIKCVTPYEAKNKSHKRAMVLSRARHETINRRFKTWGVLYQTWRNENEKHAFVFKAVVTIVQIEISNGRPPFKVDQFEDCAFI